MHARAHAHCMYSVVELPPHNVADVLFLSVHDSMVFMWMCVMCGEIQAVTDCAVRAMCVRM